MDEPIGALDAKLREEMRAELKRLHIENGLDHDLRHPRPGRGDGAGRPHRHHERRRAAAGRHARRGLSPSGQPVRRAVRRQPGHERRRRPTVADDGGTAAVTLGGADAASTSRASCSRKLEAARRRAASWRSASGPKACWSRTSRRDGYRAGRGAHHRAARRLRHRRPQGRRADAARAHHERLSSARPATRSGPASTRRRRISSTRAAGDSLRHQAVS